MSSSFRSYFLSSIRISLIAKRHWIQDNLNRYCIDCFKTLYCCTLKTLILHFMQFLHVNLFLYGPCVMKAKSYTKIKIRYIWHLVFDQYTMLTFVRKSFFHIALTSSINRCNSFIAACMECIPKTSPWYTCLHVCVCVCVCVAICVLGVGERLRGGY